MTRTEIERRGAEEAMQAGITTFQVRQDEEAAEAYVEEHFWVIEAQLSDDGFHSFDWSECLTAEGWVGCSHDTDALTLKFATEREAKSALADAPPYEVDDGHHEVFVHVVQMPGS